MKSPREILLARHESTNVKLDKIRRAAVAEITQRPAADGEPSWTHILNFLLELLSFRPQVWGGLAAVWILIFALKLTTHDVTPIASRKVELPPPQVVAELKQQKRLFAELVGATQSLDAKPPRFLRSGPRTECEQQTTII